MKIISQDKWIKVNGFPELRPKVRYVTCNEQASQYVNNIKVVDWRISDLSCEERPYGGQSLGRSSLAVMRFAGVGDLLISSALVHYIRTINPAATIHAYSMESDSASVYANHPDLSIQAAIPLPMTLDAVRQYDYHCFIDGTLELNAEPDQGNCYDDMFARYGMKDVPNKYKHPFFAALPTDDKYVNDNRINLTGQHFLYCAHTSCAVRNYPYDLGKTVIQGLLDAFPDARVFVVSMDESFVVPDDDRCISIGALPTWRNLIPFIRTSSCVIGPDSGPAHIASTFDDVPYVGLWAAFPPHARATYYKNHYVLSGAESCRHAPCCLHAWMDKLPSKCKDCTHWQEGEKACAAMREIKPEQVVEQVKALV